VTSDRDIVEALATLPDIVQNERERIVGALGPSPVDIDEVARATGVAVRKVHIVLLELALAGKL
jgi:DNA processing protein